MIRCYFCSRAAKPGSNWEVFWSWISPKMESCRQVHVCPKCCRKFAEIGGIFK